MARKFYREGAKNAGTPKIKEIFVSFNTAGFSLRPLFMSALVQVGVTS
jgi:hypothetical protein